MNESVPAWLLWAREIQAIGQSGIHFSTTEYDRQRYQRLVALAAEIFADQTGQDISAFQQSFKLQSGYATPKVDVRAAVFNRNQILLVQERADQRWSMPGGFADVNEPPSAMVEREVKEESGYLVKARKLVGVYESNHDRHPLEVYHVYKLIFLCDLIGGSPERSFETLDVGMFPLDQLPDLSLGRTAPRFIQEAYAHWLDPNRPTAFD